MLSRGFVRATTHAPTLYGLPSLSHEVIARLGDRTLRHGCAITSHYSPLSLWDRSEGPRGRDGPNRLKNNVIFCLNGGAEGDRTPDLCNAIAALSQLSYGPEPFFATLGGRDAASE